MAASTGIRQEEIQALRDENILIAGGTGGSVFCFDRGKSLATGNRATNDFHASWERAGISFQKNESLKTSRSIHGESFSIALREASRWYVPRGFIMAFVAAVLPPSVFLRVQLHRQIVLARQNDVFHRSVTKPDQNALMTNPARFLLRRSHLPMAGTSATCI